MNGLNRLAAGKILLGPSFCVLLLVAALYVIASTAFALAGNAELLMMASGSDVASVGDCIGYIGNVVDASDLEGAAIRSSFVFNLLWLFGAIVYAAYGIREAEGGLIADLSRARGVSDSKLVVRSFLYHAALFSLTYLVSAGLTGALFALKDHVSAGPSFWFRLFTWAFVNMLLVVAQYAQAACAIRLCNSLTMGSVLTLGTVFIGTAFYPSMASYGGSVQPLLVFPASRFLSSCALSEKYVSLTEQIRFCVLMLVFLCAVDMGACVLRRRFR